MQSNIDKLRTKLANGHRCLGPSISFADPTVTEAFAPSVDFVWLDLEHTAIDFETLQAHLIAARAGGVPALVRVPSSDVAWVKRILDMGADGIICPQISGVEEARQFISACHYPPDGTRGYGPRRPSNFGRLVADEDLRRANEKLFVVVQIERRSAVEELDKILAIPGLSSIVIGPWDLSGSYGKLGQLGDPEFMAIVKRIIGQARAAGICAGMAMGQDVEFARQAFNLGASWVQFGADFTYLHTFAEQLYREIRGG